MKFSEEFASQMVPEWQEAYMNYEFLKNHLKEIQLFRSLRHDADHPRAQTRGSDTVNQIIIIVNNVKRDGLEGSETMFLRAADEGGQYELVYFKKLDEEFNKVVKFYKTKVEEVMREGDALNKQMEALIAFRVGLENPEGRTNSLEETAKLASDVAVSGAALYAARRASRTNPMDWMDDENSTNQGQSDESSDDKKDGREIIPESLNVQKYEQNSIRGRGPAPLEILQHVKFNTRKGTPCSTIKGFVNLSNQNDLKFDKDNLRKAEKTPKKAFIEFHHKLRLLKSYSFLNIIAFSKIMKKYDKIASRNAAKPYMKMVDDSCLRSSDGVSKLMERVEETFIKHFANSNRSRGMDILRPKKKKENHMVTFFMGFFVGCTFALLLELASIIHARDNLHKEGKMLYMETMFPLYSLFWFIVLHMLMYAANICFWRWYGVNYSFIFGFKQETELGYREVLLLGFCLSVLALASVLANLDIEMDPVTQDYHAMKELLPLGLVLLVVVIVLCPLNIIYRSSRFFLLMCLFRCFLAPLYKVSLPDFFLADQFTSQVQALRSVEFYVCHYGWEDYKLRQNNCKENDVYKSFSFIVAVIPYWWRLLQCIRRLCEEKDAEHAYNGLRYLSTIVAVCARTAYILNSGATWKLMAWIASVIATIFSTYWDIVIDWGLFQRNSKNRWLRDKLLIPHKTVYFVAMVLNVLLRLAWIQTVMNITIFSLHKQAMIALVASLEIIRRGLWNFFRLENEHLNNVGKYHAFKSVPLPFNYDEEESKDE